MEFLTQLQPWHWLAFGAVLMILEIFVPSAIFLWPGMSAVIVGFIVFIKPDLAWTLAYSAWAILSLALIGGWQLYKRSRPETDKAPSNINRRGEQYVGRHFTLSKDIVNGVGELHVDDTRWKISSAHDLPAGTKVKVTAIQGTSLHVEEFIS